MNAELEAVIAEALVELRGWLDVRPYPWQTQVRQKRQQAIRAYLGKTLYAALLQMLDQPSLPDEGASWEAFDRAVRHVVDAAKHRAVARAAARYYERLWDIWRMGWLLEVERRERQGNPNRGLMQTIREIRSRLKSEHWLDQLSKHLTSGETDRPAAPGVEARSERMEAGSAAPEQAKDAERALDAAEQLGSQPLQVPPSSPSTRQLAELKEVGRRRWGPQQRRQFGDKLRRLRELRGWSIDELARKLYCSSDAISRWERGRSCPHPYRLPKLAEILGVSPTDLLSD